MKKILKNILQGFKDLTLYFINLLFKKAEDYIPDDLGAKFYGPNEADPRDFKIENVLKAPTDEEIKNLPAFIDLLKDATPNFKPVNQGCVPSCTASSLSNYMGIQTTKEENTKVSTQQGAETLRKQAGHKRTCKGEKGEYLETMLKTLKTNGELTNINGKQEYKNIKGYAYFNATVNNLKYWLSQGFPIYYAIRGNRETWQELSQGEVKTFNFTPTGGHCITAIGYDKDCLYFINTWTPNDGDKYKGDYSIFKISWTGFKEMLKKGLANWRGWVVYLIEEKKMFKDYNVDLNTEQGQAVKKLTDINLIKGVPHKDGTYLEPGRGITRLEVIVLLFRILKYLGK